MTISELHVALFPLVVEQLQQALDTINGRDSINTEVAHAILAKAKFVVALTKTR